MATERKLMAWEAAPGEGGYFCVQDAEGPLIQGEVERGRDPEIWVMADAPVRIDKMFGPLIFQSVRVTADLDSGDWIVERQTREGWEQVARFAGQTDEFFRDDDDA